MAKFIKQYLPSFITFHLGLLLILTIQTQYHDFEGGLYRLRMESITKDSDFNLINNASGGFGKILTPTENVADMHDVGAPVLWSGFIKFFSVFLPQLTPIQKPNEASLNTVTILVAAFNYLLFYLTLIFILNQSSLSRDAKILSVALFVLLGCHDYLFDQYFNADITAMFFMTYLLLSLPSLDFSKTANHYLLGLSLGCLRLIKITSIFYLFPFFLFGILQARKERCSRIFSFRFLLSISLFFVLAELNTYSSLGRWSFFQGYNYAYSFDHLFNLFGGWLGTYFYPKGVLLQSPILIVPILATTLLIRQLIKEKNFEEMPAKDKLILLCAPFFLVKLSLGIFSITLHYMGLGARQFFIDLPLFFLCLNLLLKTYKKTTYGLVIINLLFVVVFTISWHSHEKIPEVFGLSKVLILNPLSFAEGIQNTLKVFLTSLIRNYDLLGITTFLFFILQIFKREKESIRLRFTIIGLTSTLLTYYSLKNFSQNHTNSYQHISNSGYDSYLLSKNGDLSMYFELDSGLILAKAYEDKFGTEESKKYLQNLTSEIGNRLEQDIIFKGRSFNEREFSKNLLILQRVSKEKRVKLIKP